jgi:MFS family permease
LTGADQPDLVVTLPLAYVSDLRGRKLVLVLNMLSMILTWAVIILVGRLKSLPIEAMIAGPILTLIGGGECVLISTTAAAIADFVPDQGLRTTVFAWMSSLSYVTTLGMPALAAYTMSVNLWLPFWIGISLLVLALPIALSLPKHVAVVTEDEIEETRPLLIRTTPSGSESIISVHHPGSLYNRAVIHIKYTISHIKSRPMFQLLIGIFFLASFASSNSPLFVQYISKRYRWTFSQAGYLLSVKAAVNVTLLTVIVPFLVHLASKFGTPGLDININGTRINLAISIIGAICIAAAPKIGFLIASLVVYALGSALPVFTMSLVKSKDHSEEPLNAKGFNGQDYSIVILFKTFGTLLGIPIMTAVWTKGISIGDAAMGMPFYLSAVVYAFAGVVASFLKKVEQ